MKQNFTYCIPYNGKTSLAEALANALMIPMFTVRYESVIGTYLGETSVRLRRLFEHVCTRRCRCFLTNLKPWAKSGVILGMLVR
ncbi:MAG: AAA family ATPase [Candidatus Porifericomitaceae bacterium WSBS_2022_MAG_OTU9]